MFNSRKCIRNIYAISMHLIRNAKMGNKNPVWHHTFVIHVFFGVAKLKLPQLPPLFSYKNSTFDILGFEHFPGSRPFDPLRLNLPFLSGEIDFFLKDVEGIEPSKNQVARKCVSTPQKSTLKKVMMEASLAYKVITFEDLFGSCLGYTA